MSMSFDKELDVMNESAVRQYAVSLTDEELTSQVGGFDLGVKRQVTGSSGAVYHLSDEALAALAKLEDRRARYQRKYARMARANDSTAGTVKRKRTGGEKNMQCRIGRYSEKKAQIQNNNSHHISKKIADNTPLIAVFEDLKINNMVRKPKAKLCEDTGRWLANCASAKRGLNKALYSVNMGQIRQFTAYKLKDRGKLMVRVKPHYSSQECSQCGHAERGNRPSQATFTCLGCGYAANADDNAACVIKKKGAPWGLAADHTGGRKPVSAKARSSVGAAR